MCAGAWDGVAEDPGVEEGMYQSPGPGRKGGRLDLQGRRAWGLMPGDKGSTLCAQRPASSRMGTDEFASLGSRFCCGLD